VVGGGWQWCACLGRLVRAVGQWPRRRRTNRLGRGASKPRLDKNKKEKAASLSMNIPGNKRDHIIRWTEALSRVKRLLIGTILSSASVHRMCHATIEHRQGREQGARLNHMGSTLQTEREPCPHASSLAIVCCSRVISKGFARKLISRRRISFCGGLRALTNSVGTVLRWSKACS
jgi:hypothetical protein